MEKQQVQTEQDVIEIVLDDVQPETQQPQTTTSVQQESEEAVKARASGWKPKEEFTGDVSKWVDAGEFLRRGELFERLHTQTKEMKQLRDVVNKLVEHNKKLDARTAEDTISQLKAAKQLALDEGNTRAVVELDDRLLEARENLREVKAATKQEVASEIPPEYYAFADANPWYMKDRAMTAFADQIGRELIEQGYHPSAIYEKVAKEVRNEFAHKFASKPAVQAVEASRASVNSPRSIKFTPTAEERQVAKIFAQSGVMTEKQYYEQLAKSRA